MPRKMRIEYAGALYHVMSRGNRREQIYRDEKAIKQLEYTKEKLCQSKKGSTEKKVIATILKERTSVKNIWISQRLKCGHPGNISKYVKEVKNAKRGNKLCKLYKTLLCED